MNKDFDITDRDSLVNALGPVTGGKLADYLGCGQHLGGAEDTPVAVDVPEVGDQEGLLPLPETERTSTN